jgi:hypothetical protein
MEGDRGIAPLIFNLGLDESECLTSHSGLFTPREESRYPLNRRLGGSQGMSGFDSRTVKPVA